MGKVLIQDDSSSSFLAPSTQITACLVDENTAFANGTYTVLKNGLTDVCKLVSADGSFSLIGTNVDPDTTSSSDRADVAVEFRLKNNDISHVEGKKDDILYYYSTVYNNYNSWFCNIFGSSNMKCKFSPNWTSSQCITKTTIEQANIGFLRKCPLFCGVDGSGSSDPDGDNISYSWIQTSGTGVTLSDSTAQQPTFTAPNITVKENLIFELTVTDAKGKESLESDAVTIQLIPKPTNSSQN